MPTRCRTRQFRAFTLVEMLVVLLVISLLVSLSVPTYTITTSVAKRVGCAANQRQIGIAFSRFAMKRWDTPTTDTLNEEMDFRPTTWPESLSPYLGDNPRILLCPESDEDNTSYPDVRVRVWWIGVRDEMLFTHYPYWNESDYASLDTVCHMWKVNDDFYQTGVKGGANLPRYTPGTNPNLCWYLVEDIGDDDFYDFDTRVEDKRELNFVRVTGYHAANALATHAIVGPDGTVYGEGEWVVGPKDFWMPLTHFGMNSQAARFKVGTQKILLLDYADLICDTGSNMGVDLGYDIYIRPRHRGLVNVLFGDGSVRTMDPEEIDPMNVGDAPDRYWNPDIP